MPDVVIRGLDMPRPIAGEAGYIDFRIFSDGTAIMASAKQPYYKRFEAVALPEGHGRLVDAREVLEKADKAPWFDGDVSELGLLLGSEVATIVPADSGRPMTAPTSGAGDPSPTEGEGTDSSVIGPWGATAPTGMTETEGG